MYSKAILASIDTKQNNAAAIKKYKNGRKITIKMPLETPLAAVNSSSVKKYVNNDPKSTGIKMTTLKKNK
ncbi:hypothetical protein GCM10010954_02880 [Halobacillus andaensis]|uniref:Uncharacterized protein n=1 Tax=Halobacillus andaensis TaxID=1176239 RepID=A0A917AYN8_HALAA|nr:hypothetical protein GCM10010954_02880 [Halobacillus andaensis]